MPAISLVVFALCVTLASALLKSGLPLDIGPRRELEFDSKNPLKNAAPMVINLDQCTGTFKQLVDGIAMGVVLGAQILLPGGDALLDMRHLSHEVEDLYREVWCTDNSANAPTSLSRLWCGKDAYRPLVSSASALSEALAAPGGVEDPNVKIHSAEPAALMSGRSLQTFRSSLLSTVLQGDGGHAHHVVNINCTLLSLKVVESDKQFWSLWWRVSDALDFTGPIKEAASSFVRQIEAHGKRAQDLAKARGFPPLRKPLERGRAFNALHLRVDNDWVQTCNEWMGREDGIHRDNCMNNTQSIAGVLVTEGLDPRLPLYVDVPLTTDELIKMGNSEIQGQHGRGFLGLTEAFIVITKGTILNELDLEFDVFAPEQWDAVDLLIASAANDYVGNSVAVESAYTMVARHQHGKSAWHYNGGSMPLRESGALAPFNPLSVPTLREPLKWVFTLHLGEGNLSGSYLDMVKVAVLSARRHTSLIPVCITTADPTSEISRWLVSQGVRVVHHAPAWGPEVAQRARELQQSPVYGELKDRSHLYADPDAMVGSFMLIDLPILGILDEFVLYTDVDVLFRSEIDWSTLLPGVDLDSVRRKNDFARGQRSLAEPGLQGLPLYLAASSEIEMSEDPEMMNDGVMLMNLRSLREVYPSLQDFVLADPDLQWDEGPGAQGAIRSFLSSGGPVGHQAPGPGQPRVNFLPWVLNWKPYWAPNPEARLVHFHGPKCSSDIQPYIQASEVRTELFRYLLEGCTRTGDCKALCRDFDAYLSPPA